VTLALVLAPLAEARGQDADDCVGKRVVQKVRDFTLKIDDEPVERSGKAIEFCRVLRTDGPLLWLKAETSGATGGAALESVVLADKAIEFFTNEIAARPQSAFAYAMRAFLRHDRKQLDLALQDYDQAIRLDPRDALFYCGRGDVQQARHEYDQAIADFDLALRLDPKNTYAYIGRGLSRSGKREYTKAIAEFNEAIWIDPLSIAGYLNRALAWHSKREYQKAVYDYNLVIRLDPQKFQVFCHRGRAWAALKRYDRAIGDFNEAIRQGAQHPDGYSALAWLLSTCPDAKVRDGARAVAAATRACELTGWNDRACLETLASACAAAGDFDAALNWQTKANALPASAADQSTGEAKLKLYRDKRPYLEPNP
jgi:tetratricopeptide (TPR) repeat protein